ncbi:olfactomedin-4-like [Leuresthes tenuis]|uniref:olfactomedin-4-like n=1 Tax=Leuresthes tenuis TaxID=355514 RepID=UPI003B511112
MSLCSIMKLSALVPLCALFTLTQQTASLDRCACELFSSEKAFPHDKLETAQNNASDCNSNVTPQKTFELESLLLGLDRRLPQLEEDVEKLEKENDGELYGALSLHIIENELFEIMQLFEKLNSTAQAHQDLADEATQQLQDLRSDMQDLEKFDTVQVVKKQQANQRLKRDLDQCRNGIHPTSQPTRPPKGACPHGQFLNVTGPRVYTAGEYPGSHKYGAWGRDPKPEAGKENWHWLVMLTASNRYSNYVRLYSTLSSLIAGVSVPGNVQIHPSNPTTNTIQGPNVVLYGGALYYNCYNKDAICQFSLTTKSVTTIQLPKGTRYNSKGNFCQLEECYPYTDMDLATDESGVWVIYTTTQDFGNLVLSKVERGEQPALGQTWRTSVYKQSVTNTFMACGVLYATRYVDKHTEEIFYSFDTATGRENFTVGIFVNKMSPNIESLNYSPVDQMLHAYCDSYMVSYKVLFG